jgi:hypothetical protein
MWLYDKSRTPQVWRSFGVMRHPVRRSGVKTTCSASRMDGYCQDESQVNGEVFRQLAFDDHLQDQAEISSEEHGDFTLHLFHWMEILF